MGIATMKKVLTLKEYHSPDRRDKSQLSADELPAPSVAIRAHCLECLGWNDADVRRCDGELVTGKCPLWALRRRGKRGLSPGKAIRQECLLCMDGNKDYVRNCESTRCALWPYRFGSNPRTNRRARARFEAGKPREADIEEQKGPPADTVEE